MKIIVAYKLCAFTIATLLILLIQIKLLNACSDHYNK